MEAGSVGMAENGTVKQLDQLLFQLILLILLILLWDQLFHDLDQLFHDLGFRLWDIIQ